MGYRSGGVFPQKGERDMNYTPFVSVIIPVRNEQNYLDACIRSILEQDYPHEHMEVFFVDGQSTDSTCCILARYQNRFPSLFYILDNPHHTVPYAMNRGIRASKGEFIIRLDAHAEYAKDYISQCVRYLQQTDADNVGGAVITKSKGFMGGAIAQMLSSPFGVGNSAFRTNGKDGYVDTVPFGAFRREVFDKYGYYDERLTRNQDNEMNYRIRKGGGKILMSHDIQLSYYCRNTLRGILKMGVQNGKWNIITLFLCPGAMSLRHFVPFFFVFSLITLPLLGMICPLFWWLLSVEGCCYFLLDLFCSIRCAFKSRGGYFPLLLVLFPLFHISYGLGSFAGFLVLPKILSKGRKST